MVAHFVMHSYGVNQKCRFVEDIWLHRKRRQNRFFFREKPILHYMCATCSKLPSHKSIMQLLGTAMLNIETILAKSV